MKVKKVENFVEQSGLKELLGRAKEKCQRLLFNHWGPTFLDQSHLLVEKFAIFVLYLETRGAKKIKLS